MSTIEYYRQRRAARKAWAYATLGGKCAECGATESLEFDHVDPALKEFNIGQNWLIRQDRFEAEVLKCQLLCSSCHALKTYAPGNVVGRPPVPHGGGKGGRVGCKCDLCVAKKREAGRERSARYYQRKREAASVRV